MTLPTEGAGSPLLTDEQLIEYTERTLRKAVCYLCGFPEGLIDWNRRGILSCEDAKACQARMVGMKTGNHTNWHNKQFARGEWVPELTDHEHYKEWNNEG